MRRLRLIPEAKPPKAELLLRILLISSADEPSRAAMVEARSPICDSRDCAVGGPVSTRRECREYLEYP